MNNTLGFICMIATFLSVVLWINKYAHWASHLPFGGLPSPQHKDTPNQTVVGRKVHRGSLARRIRFVLLTIGCLCRLGDKKLRKNDVLTPKHNKILHLWTYPDWCGSLQAEAVEPGSAHKGSSARRIRVVALTVGYLCYLKTRNWGETTTSQQPWTDPNWCSLLRTRCHRVRSICLRFLQLFFSKLPRSCGTEA